MYGADARKPGTYAANCLLARRLAERGVRFIQLFHRDWDHHGNLPKDLPKRCKETDQASAALVMDLKQRGLLDETLVVWGGEFGRTVYCQGRLTAEDYGARSPSPLLHGVDGWRGNQARDRDGRNGRRPVTTLRRARFTYTTCRQLFSNASASITRA